MEHVNPCNPSPCGTNAVCKNNGECVCLPEYYGDPFFSCRPECVLSSDCSLSQTCVRNKCVDPCISMCGINAECHAYNHVAICSCPNNMTGDAFDRCFATQSMFESFKFL